MELKTCHHSFDNGSFSKAPALRGRDYCCYHLNHRGRLMRIARERAQNERLFLALPPLENMHAVQSALSQVLEAVAADMIDLKRAQFLLAGLRHAASNFKNPKAWLPSAYVNDPEAPGLEAYPEFEAEYELPNNLNLAIPPEVAFRHRLEETMAAAQLPADSNSGDGTFSPPRPSSSLTIPSRPPRPTSNWKRSGKTKASPPMKFAPASISAMNAVAIGVRTSAPIMPATKPRPTPATSAIPSNGSSGKSWPPKSPLPPCPRPMAAPFKDANWPWIGVFLPPTVHRRSHPPSRPNRCKRSPQRPPNSLRHNWIDITICIINSLQTFFP